MDDEILVDKRPYKEKDIIGYTRSKEDFSRKEMVRNIIGYGKCMFKALLLSMIVDNNLYLELRADVIQWT